MISDGWVVYGFMSDGGRLYYNEYSQSGSWRTGFTSDVKMALVFEREAWAASAAQGQQWRKKYGGFVSIGFARVEQFRVAEAICG